MEGHKAPYFITISSVSFSTQKGVPPIPSGGKIFSSVSNQKFTREDQDWGRWVNILELNKLFYNVIKNNSLIEKFKYYC